MAKQVNVQSLCWLSRREISSLRNQRTVGPIKCGINDKQVGKRVEFCIFSAKYSQIINNGVFLSNQSPIYRWRKDSQFGRESWRQHPTKTMWVVFNISWGIQIVGLTLGEGVHLFLPGSHKWMWYIAIPSNPQLDACQMCMSLIVVVAL